MKKWFSAAFAAAVLLTGCSATPASGQNQNEPAADQEDQKKTQEPEPADEKNTSQKTDSSSQKDSSTSDKPDETVVLSVDEILQDPESCTGRQILVKGETPQTVLKEDAQGNPISLLYQEGKAGDTDHAIRFIVPKDAPGTSVIEVSGTLNQDEDGYILEDTALVQ